jgi:hypothetical protein
MPRHGPQGERGGLLSLLALCLEEVDDLCCVCLAGCVICLAAADGHEADVAVGINRVKDYSKRQKLFPVFGTANRLF